MVRDPFVDPRVRSTHTLSAFQKSGHHQIALKYPATPLFYRIYFLRTLYNLPTHVCIRHAPLFYCLRFSQGLVQYPDAFYIHQICSTCAEFVSFPLA